MIKILNYFHYSNKDITSDSNFYFQKKLIDHLHEDKNIYWYITCPKEHSSYFYKNFDYDNVEVIPLNYVSTALWNRNWLDYSIRDQLDKTIIDIAFVNTPELAIDIISALSYFSKPRLITYTHWIPETEGSLGPYSPAEKFLYLGAYSIAQYNCFNSKYGMKMVFDLLKPLISDNMQKMFMGRAIDIAPYLESELINYTKEVQPHSPTAVFNHRISEYTGYSFLFDVLKQYDKQYADQFNLQFSNFASMNNQITEKNLNKMGYNSVKLVNPPNNNRTEYYDLLKSSDFCFGFHNGKSQWSMSFMDALLADCIPLYIDNYFYREIFSKYPLDLTPFKISDLKVPEAAFKLNLMVKNASELRNKYKFKEYILSRYGDDIITDKYRRMFYEVYNNIPNTHGMKSEKLNLAKMQSGLINLNEIASLTNQSGARDFNAIIKNLVENFGFREVLKNRQLFLQHNSSGQRQLL